MKKLTCYVATIFLFLTGGIASPRCHGMEAQLGLSCLKTVTRLWASRADLSDPSAAKRAAFAKMVASVADGAAKTVEYSRYMRDGVSLGAHMHAALWQIAGNVEEYATIAKLQAQYGDGLPVAVLKKLYPNFDTCDLDLNEEVDFEEEGKSKAKKGLCLVCHLTELGLAAWLACGKTTPNQRRGIMIGRAACDLLLRFLCNEKQFASPSWLGRANAVASALPSVYDIGRSVYDVATQAEDKPPAWGDTCAACGVQYGQNNVTACQMMNCKHWCCEGCTKKNQQEIEVGREIKYFIDDNELTPEAVEEMPDWQRDMARREIVHKKPVTKCQVCQMRNQVFKPTIITDPNVKKDVIGVDERLEFDHCPICFDDDPAKHKKKLGCKHVFCHGCIRQWYNGGHDNCPVCQKKFRL